MAGVGESARGREGGSVSEWRGGWVSSSCFIGLDQGVRIAFVERKRKKKSII